MNNTDHLIFEALDYMYILGAFKNYQEVIYLFQKHADKKEPIPNELKKKMFAALKLRRKDGRLYNTYEK